MEKNIIGKRYFDNTSFQVLSNTAENCDLEIIQDAVESFTSYVKDVDVGEQQIKLAYATMDGDELRQRVTAIDARRRRHHEDAISNVKLLNRLAEIYQISAIFTGEIEDRLQVADFCLDITVELFEARKRG